MRRKIWIVSELFYPDEVSTGYIMTCIAQSLAENCEVHVICGPTGYDQLKNEREILNFNFEIHRINVFNFNKNFMFSRMLKLSLLSMRMFFRGLFVISRRDKVLIVTNPAFIIPFYSLLARIIKFEYYVLVHDVFPENLLVTKIIGSARHPFYRFLKRIYNWSYKQASTLVVLGEDMLKVMQRKTASQVHIEIIQNWACTDEVTPCSFSENELIRAYQLEDKVVFLFAGNIGRVQGLDFLLEIIAQVHNPLVHFLIIGDGAFLPALKESALNKQLTNVTFIPPISREKQNVFLNACHVGLVTLSPDLIGLGVPSKSYNIMAAGKPILFIGSKETEIAQMVIRDGCGYAFEESECNTLLTFLNGISDEQLFEFRKLGEAARLMAETKYSKPAILKKLKDTLHV